MIQLLFQYLCQLLNRYSIYLHPVIQTPEILLILLTNLIFIIPKRLETGFKVLEINLSVLIIIEQITKLLQIVLINPYIKTFEKFLQSLDSYKIVISLEEHFQHAFHLP